MHLSRDEEAALAGKRGDIMQMAYRILVATGEATDAERLVPVEWVHLSGVNYNTIGDAGEEFLRSIRNRARVKVRTTLNPMGFDSDSVNTFGLDEEFIRKQWSIQESYEMIGVTMSFSCIPYDVFPMPEQGSQVAFAESNAAIHANSFDGLKTNKESAFSALASALTGKSPYSAFRGDVQPDTAIDVRIDDPTDLDWGMLGYFAGKVADGSAVIRGSAPQDRRSCKALCGGMGTSGTCAKFSFGDAPAGCERVSFGKSEANSILDELNTAEHGDAVILGSPQLGMGEVADLVAMLGGRRFTKRCMLFCPRAVKEQAAASGHAAILERAGCQLLADCCACLTPLVTKDDTDSVTTNSIKGAYYLNKSNKVGVCLKPLAEIIRDETR